MIDGTIDGTINDIGTAVLAQRRRVVDEAYSWLGTPYHHRARVKGSGVDCLMILCEIYHACGLIPYVNPPDYPPDWHLHKTEQRYLDGVLRYAIETDRPQLGDVMLFQFGHCFSHAAVVVGDDLLIHAHALAREVCLVNQSSSTFLKNNGQPRAVKYFSLFGAGDTV
jgi:NlpC/P60 family putative phage cell wall peptidase